jgi:branched-chain amino acid transport system permease protein
MAILVPPGVRIMPDQVLVLGLTGVLVVGMWLFLTMTRAGLAMRAVAESPTLSEVSGIDVRSVTRWTWILSGALAAMAGVFFGLTVQLRPEMGFNLLLPLFAAAILGGAGSVFGAVVGGLIVGLAENLSVLVISPGYKMAVPFILMLVLLYIRPHGLFGKAS